MSKNYHWTAENIPDLSGKSAVITGANSGIGYETALALAGKGATTILACRSQSKGETAVAQIRRQFPQAPAELMPLDLADLAAVRHFAVALQERIDRLDLLINNAGVMAPPFGQTADGFELQFGVNHLGHFALTGLLLDLIKRASGSRVVTVSSLMHRRGQIDFDNLNGERGYNRAAAYGQSKLANLLFTYELQRKLDSAQIDTLSVAAHPGWAATNLQQHSRPVNFMNRFLAQSAAMGALPTLYAATAPDVQGGDYYGPGRRFESVGYPRKVASNGRSHDTAVATRLWAISEQLTGVEYPFTQQ